MEAIARLTLGVMARLFWVLLYVHSFREVLNNQFGHLPFATELIIFGLATAAVFAGLLEMMMREQAGIPRPSYGSSKHTGPRGRE